VISRLPSIQRLEVIISRALAAGLVLLTVGLVCGVGYLKQKRGVYFSTDASVLYSFVVWLVYLGVLVAHWRFAQRGRRFAWSVVGIFLFVMLTFWGFYLLSDLHNPPPSKAGPKESAALEQATIAAAAKNGGRPAEVRWLARIFHTPHEAATACRRRPEEAKWCSLWPTTPPPVGVCRGGELSAFRGGRPAAPPLT
jgi:energy-coupling factor transporter transmembrane protein EcfT